MSNNNDWVPIRVKRSTREKLKDIGTKRETYDALIQRLIRESGK